MQSQRFQTEVSLSSVRTCLQIKSNQESSSAITLQLVHKISSVPLSQGLQDTHDTSKGAYRGT